MMNCLLSTLFLLFSIAHAEKPNLIDKIEVHKLEKFGPATEFKSTPDENDTFATLKISSSQFGKITGGKYKGSKLMLVKTEYQFEGPCAGGSYCGPEINYYRFIKTDKEMIFVETASVDKFVWVGSKDPNYRTVFKQFNLFPGYKVEINSDLEIDGFNLPNEMILDNNPRKKLDRSGDHVGSSFDVKDMLKISSYKNVPVYTIQPDQSGALKTFRNGAKNDKLSNGFYVKNLDGTETNYYYSPDIYKDLVDRRVSASFAEEYTHAAFLECSGNLEDVMDVVTAAVKKEPAVVAKAFNGDNLYLPTEEMLKEFFDYYNRTKSEYINVSSSLAGSISYFEQESGKPIKIPKDFAEFKKMNPMLLWKNPFGQWVRLVQYRFLIPRTCG